MGEVAPFIAPLFSSLSTFDREPTGFLRCVSRDSKAENIAKGQVVYSPRGKAGEIADAIPAVNAPDTENPDLDNVGITIEAEKIVPIKLDGNETLGLDASGNYDAVLTQRMQDAVRKLANYAENFIAAKVVAGACRAYGDGTTEFFKDKDTMPEFANMARILDENGCPDDSRNFVLSNAAMANLRTYKSILLNSYALGSDEFLRYGYTDPILNLRLWKSAGYAQHKTGSTGAGYKVAAATAAGATTVTLDTGAGTINVGDVITFGSDTGNSYVVTKGISAAGDIEIGYPGLRQALAKADTVTVVNTFNPCVAFHSDAVRVAFRAPALPKGGDEAGQHYTITDPATGLVIDVGHYTQYRQSRLELGIAIGCSVLQPENVALLSGK